MEEKAELLNTEKFNELEEKLAFVGVVASEGSVDDRGTSGMGGFTPAEDIFTRDYNIDVLCTRAASQDGQYVVEVSRPDYLSKARKLGVKTEMGINNPNRVFGFVYKNN